MSDGGHDSAFEDSCVGQELYPETGKKFSVPGKRHQQVLGAEITVAEVASLVQRGSDDDLCALVAPIEHLYLLRPRRT